ncbi:hypothetical protein KIN20_007800 [Parelaphostrongylus tenuis]|uniref:Uncharacterized protein n=1 Tax=Parelaphostrongylus tenuis TaxID=148309 RepID=A0AAD5QM91_PARTN|nr:hypothetical protein KIN20_007800 [Parelaphostrongylus tenuis]
MTDISHIQLHQESLEETGCILGLIMIRGGLAMYKMCAAVHPDKGTNSPTPER